MTPNLILPAAIFLALLFASFVCAALRYSPLNAKNPTLVIEIIKRTYAWWLMCLVLVPAIVWGFYPTLIIFFFISIRALREYLTLIETGRAQHRALFWSFALITPMQYYLIGISWYGLYSIFIPVYASIFIAAAIVIQGETDRFLERTAEIQWGLMMGVFFLSHAPALFTLDLSNRWQPGMPNANSALLFFLIIVSQLSDVLQFVSGKLFGRKKIAPEVSPNKTWGGLIGGAIGSIIIGAFFSSVTIFSPVQAALMAVVIVISGFFGGLIMSAIKRDYGVKDYGELIPGHGGILDRVDSLIFSAPLFFHITRYFFTT